MNIIEPRVFDLMKKAERRANFSRSDSQSSNSNAKLPTIDDFIFVKPISRGAFGKVFLGHKKGCPDKIYAIKAMKKAEMINKNMAGQVVVERDALAASQNPFIVQLFYSFQSQQYVFLVMDYMIGGDLKSLLAIYGYFDEEMATLYTAEVAHALAYLHGQGIIHRDLKPDNMLVGNNGHIKLTDFGLSKISIGLNRSQLDVSRTPNSCGGKRKMDYYLTPGQILSVHSSLAFGLTPMGKRSHSSLSESPIASRLNKSYQTPLKEMVMNSPFIRPQRSFQLREQALNNSTISKVLSPPVKSLTPTLQDSLNWPSSVSEQSFALDDRSLCGRKRSSCARDRHSSILQSSLAQSQSAVDDDVFPLNQPHSKCGKSFLTHLSSISSAGSDVFPSVISEPASDIGDLEDTPQLHKTNESVWNSYAARNLRSMREGSYSEESEGEHLNSDGHDFNLMMILANQHNRNNHRRQDGAHSHDNHNDCIRQSPIREKYPSQSSQDGNTSDENTSRDFSYHSDDDVDMIASSLVRKNSYGGGRKRSFDDMRKSHNGNSTGLTQEIHVLSLVGDENRVKRRNMMRVSEHEGCRKRPHFSLSPNPSKSTWSILDELQREITAADQGHSSDSSPEGFLTLNPERERATRWSTMSHINNARGDSLDANSSGSSNGSLRSIQESLYGSGASRKSASSGTSGACPSSPMPLHLGSDQSDTSQPPEHSTLNTSISEERERHSSGSQGNQKEIVWSEPDPIAHRKVKTTRFRNLISGGSQNSVTSQSACIMTTPNINKRNKNLRFQTPRTPVHFGQKTPFRTPKSVRRGPEPVDDKRILGTPDYLAPEILQQIAHGPAVDWWALGACLFEFLTGVPPFNDQTPELVFKNILARDIPWPVEEESLSENAQTAIDQLLTFDPDERPEADDVQKMALFDGLDWDNLLDREPAFIPQPEDDTDTTYFEARNNMQELLVSAIDL